MSRLFLKILAVLLISRVCFWGLAQVYGTDFLAGICQWDCGWYVATVNEGYRTLDPAAPQRSEANWAFFPLYPLTVRGVAVLTGLGPLAAGVLVSNVAMLLGVLFLVLYLRRTRARADENLLILLCLAGPYSFYFASVYSEGLFFGLASLSLLLLARGRTLPAAATAAALSATRPVGVFWVVALLWQEYRTHGRKVVARILSDPRLLLAMALAPLGLFLYMLYLHLHMGDALAFSHVQAAWGRATEGPWYHLAWSLTANDLPRLLAPGVVERKSFQYWGLVAVAGLFLAGWLFRQGRHFEAMFGLFALLLPLASGVDSIPRYLVGTPVFVLAFHDLIAGRSWRWGLAAAGVGLNIVLLWNWYGGAPFLT